MRPFPFPSARRVVGATFLAAAIPAIAAAQALEQQALVPAGGTSTQAFGVSVDIDGTIAVSGASTDDTKSADAGTAYIFRFDAASKTWLQEQQIFASDFEAGARFGASVAVAGNVVAVGASYDDNPKGTDAGAVYVFRYNTSTHIWNEEQKLTASIGAGGDHFGTAIALSGTQLVAGAPQADVKGSDSGNALVYNYQGTIVKWVEEKSLADPSGVANDWSGDAVAISGSVLLVGAPLTDVPFVGYDVGSVAVWRKVANTWTYETRLQAIGTTYYDHFGSAVAIDGDTVAIGGPYVDGGGSSDGGAAYVFKYSGGTWSQEQQLLAPDHATSDHFGSSIALRGDFIAVGSPDDDAGQTDNGSVWGFRLGKHGWVADQLRIASDHAASDHFGYAVALGATDLIVGAPNNDQPAGTDVGGAYLYPTAEIVMSITPNLPAAGAPITFSALHGEQNDPVMITLEEINGVPTFVPLIFFVFGADHTFTFSANAPNPLMDLTLGFRAYKISPTGPIVVSAIERVDV